MFQRTLKKITLYLLEKVSVRNKYKSNDEKEYLVAYTETFAMFSKIFLEGIHTPNIMERFLEFICIYYPLSKVSYLLNTLEKEGSIEKEFKDNLEHIMNRRDRTSKKDFSNFVRNNLCMKTIMKYCKEVFDNIGEKLLKGKAKKSVERVLSNYSDL